MIVDIFFMYVKAYSELMAYSGIFRTIDIFIQFQARYSYYSKAIYAYSETCLRRFRHIQNLEFFRQVIFHAPSGIFTKLHSWLHLVRNIYPHSGTFRQIEAYSGSLHYRYKQCKPTLAFMSSSSFKSLFKSIWNIIFVFASKVERHSTFASLGQYFHNNNNSNNNIPPTLVRQARHTHYMTSMQTHQPHLAGHPRKYATDATHARILPTLSMLAQVAYHFSNSLKDSPL